MGEDKNVSWFNELEVYFSATPVEPITLENPKTKELFKEDTLLKGEDAYLFLVAVNAADKEYTTKLKKMSLNYVCFKLNYQGYKSDTEISIDLGSLDLMNCTLLAEGLSKRCPRYVYDIERQNKP